MTALLFLKENWKTLATSAMILILFGSVFWKGRDYERLICNTEIAGIKSAQVEEKESLQAKADELSKKYETERQKAAKSLKTLKGELDELRKSNTAYSICRAGPEWLRLYKSLCTP